MRVARWLVVLGALVFGFTGIAYLVVPGVALGIVGIASVPQTDFLLRTEGVALVTAALVLWAVRDAGPVVVGPTLLALAFYLLIGSLVDLEAFTRDIVGPASLPSATVRIALGVVCAVSGIRLRRAER